MNKYSIKTRVLMLRMASELNKGTNKGVETASGKFQRETADVLEALSETYNALYVAALEAVQEGRLDSLRAYLKPIEAKAAEVESERSGAM